MLFIKQFLKSPMTIGSVCPSGIALSHTMAEMALGKNEKSRGLFVDLGAGTGVVSRELLKHGILPEEILAIDICEDFKDAFHKSCPQLELRIGDARDLQKIIYDEYSHLRVMAIISSLPLKSMGSNLVSMIMYEIWKILHERGGILIQYTYALWMQAALTRYGFSLVSKRYIANNFPPCLVEKYYIM